MSDYIPKHCEPCNDGQNQTRDATKYCVLCEESLCENCAKAHETQKATRNHDLTDIKEYLENTQPLTTICEPCSENGESIAATSRCVECEEAYCDNCARIHKSQKATRKHNVTELTVEKVRDVCEACSYNEIDRPAAFRCITCDEVLCHECTKAHKSQKATRTHPLQEHGNADGKPPVVETSPDTPTKTDCCDLCKDYKNITTVAEAFCFNCRYALCRHCAKDHAQSSDSNKHRIIQTTEHVNEPEADVTIVVDTSLNSDESVQKASKSNDINTGCGHCGLMDGRNIAAFCVDCNLKLCQECKEEHEQCEDTKLHRFDGQIKQEPDMSNGEPLTDSKKIAETDLEDRDEPTGKLESAGQTDICQSCQLESVTGICFDCLQKLCEACVIKHTEAEDTKTHRIANCNYSKEDQGNGTDNKKIDKADSEDRTEHSGRSEATADVCQPCQLQGVISPVTAFCFDCLQKLCEPCVTKHTEAEDTKTHRIANRNDSKEDQDKGADNKKEGQTDSEDTVEPSGKSEAAGQTDVCHSCQLQGITSPVTAFCFDCLQKMCEACVIKHTEAEDTKTHKVANRNNSNDDQDKGADTKKEEKKREEDSDTGSKIRTKPGKPMQVGALKVDSVTITWSAPEQLFESCCYQVRYKETTQDSKWHYYDEDKTSNTSLTVKNLQSHSAFLLQVRMVNNEEEGPYSEISDPIETLPSAAEIVLNLTHEMHDLGSQLKLRKFRLNENTAARNLQLKTRKLILGEDPRCQKEKTILLLGASGTGKTTFVNGLVNYIFGVTFADKFRFSIIDTAEDETDVGTIGTKAPPKTKWITCYTVYPVKGSKTDYRLTIIDTPGFGDKSIEKDEEIKQQLKELFSAVDEKGVLFVDAVCIFMRASESRLTVTQKYIYTTITSLFHKDIEENICSVITFSDGKPPAVLSALKDANLPYETYFPFNTTEIFADNLKTSQTSLTKVFFDLNVSSFESFTKKLGTLKTKSLSQSTQVLKKRQQIEETAGILLSKVESGLNKMEDCKSEIEALEKYKTQMKDNKDYIYKRQKHVQILIPLAKGRHTTNCLHCNVTCHDNCAYGNDEDKAQCVAMDGNGYCKRCEDHCFWKEHKNTPFIIEWRQEEEECTYEEMKQKYQKASDEVVTHEAIVNRMKKELDEVENEMLDLMKKIADCSNQLSQMALRANPLSVAEHIDIIIENEKWERKPGFQERINNLEKLKKRIAVGEEFEYFQKSKEDILK